MESKDMVHESHSIYHHRGRRTPFHIDPSTFERKPIDSFPIESSPSPASSVNMSPVTQGVSRENSMSLAPEGDYDATREPTSGPQRSRLPSASSIKGKTDRDNDKEKRKRSRVTPEQLVHLERFFSVDRSPTAARRKEISELLGMQERQTQIWFQNRRAKAKLQDGKKGRGESAEAPPDTPPELATGYEVDLHNLIHEDEVVTIIPCTDLSVGTWRRIATTVSKHDLVAYVCETKRCLTWFIHSAGYGFKMEIPFDSILDTQFTNAAPGSGLATFILSQPPNFYLENLCTPRPDGSGGRIWKRCADWTEGMQATKVLRHDLIGSAVQLAHLLRNLSTSTRGPDIRLHSPPYYHDGQPSTPAVDVPQLPMAGLNGPGYHYRSDTLDVPRSEYLIQGRKRSYSVPELHHSTEGSGYPTINVTSSANVSHASPVPHPSYHRLSGRTHSNSINSPMFSEYPESESNHPSPADYDYDSAHILGEQGQRLYSIQPISQNYYDEDELISPYQIEAIRRNSSSGSAPATDLDTPSPPILTTPFHPPPEMLHGPKPSEIITGLPTVSYESDDDIHRG